ncbi:MAG: hypothetical protein H5T86_13085 [Armatimonadetes bacterium]|nr:hypothetical protein [Armatimonadota bacterium]
MSGLRDRVRDDESPLQRLLDFIPGFRGYRERELRRRADQLLRDHLVGLLDGARAKLRHFAGKLSRAGRLAALEALDRAIGLLTKVRDKLRYADYGYTGWFDTPQIREEELDRVYEYDLSLREFIATIQARVDACVGADEAGLAAALHELEEAIGQLEEMIDRRGEVIARLLPET